MPTEEDYRTKSKLYRLFSKNGPEYYIGSTTKLLNLRFSEHKAHSKRENIKIIALKTFNKIGWDNIKIELIQDCSDMNITAAYQLYKIEEQYRLDHNCDKDPNCLNIFKVKKEIIIPEAPKKEEKELTERQIYVRNYRKRIVKQLKSMIEGEVEIGHEKKEINVI